MIWFAGRLLPLGLLEQDLERTFGWLMRHISLLREYENTDTSAGAPSLNPLGITHVLD